MKHKEEERNWSITKEKDKQESDSKWIERLEREREAMNKTLEDEIQRYRLSIDERVAQVRSQEESKFKVEQSKLEKNNHQLEQQVEQLQKHIETEKQQSSEEFAEWKRTILQKEVEWKATVDKIQLENAKEVESLKDQLKNAEKVEADKWQEVVKQKEGELEKSKLEIENLKGQLKSEEEIQNVQKPEEAAVIDLSDNSMTSISASQNEPKTPLTSSKDASLSTENTNRNSGSTASMDNDVDEDDEEEVEWMDDSLVTYCPLCVKQFSAIRRKHHCRRCGRIFCGNCSSHNILIPDSHFKSPERVCDLCFDVIHKLSKRNANP